MNPAEGRGMLGVILNVRVVAYVMIAGENDPVWVMELG